MNMDEQRSHLVTRLVWTHLSWIEVRASQQVLQVDVSLRLGLFQHDHGVGLPEERTGCTQLSQLDQLQHDLVGKQHRHSHLKETPDSSVNLTHEIKEKAQQAENKIRQYVSSNF